MKDKLIYFQFALLVALAIYVFTRPVKERIIVRERAPEITAIQSIEPILLPKKVSFAGEPVPLNDPDVRERLDRELHVITFWHSNTIFLLKRGNRWLPEIEKILTEKGLPADFKYLAVIESDLKNGVSGAGAVGFWQLLKGTAKDFGLEVNNEVDERYHPLKSTEVACQYLLKAKEKFGTWTNAAASYNIGMRGLSNRLEEQGVDNYYDLLLNEETSRYVLRAVAAKMVFEDPEKYGFDLAKEELYETEKLKTVEIDSTLENLRDFAFQQNINYKILKRHNPWLRKNELTVRKGKKYELLIPVK